MNSALQHTIAINSTAAPEVIEPWFHWAQPDATLVAAILATCGWVYTARKARGSARKQHTINVIMQGEFNDTFRDAERVVGPHLRTGASIELTTLCASDRLCFTLVLNRYEFLAAGVRNGDFDEKLVSDTLRGAALTLFEICEQSLYVLRDTRRRQTLYEHLEWLHCRWKRRPPRWPQRLLEWSLARPLYGKQNERA